MLIEVRVRVRVSGRLTAEDAADATSASSLAWWRDTPRICDDYRRLIYTNLSEFDGR